MSVVNWICRDPWYCSSFWHEQSQIHTNTLKPYMLFNAFKLCNGTNLICLIEAQSRNAWEFRKILEPSTVKLLAFLSSPYFPISLFIFPSRSFFASLDHVTNMLVCIITEVRCYNFRLVNGLIAPICKFRDIEDSEPTWKGIHCWCNQRWPREWVKVEYNGS